MMNYICGDIFQRKSVNIIEPATQISKE